MDSVIADLMDLDDAYPVRAVTAEITAASADSALVSFAGQNGQSTSGILPVSAYTAGPVWGVGDKLVALQVASTPKAMVSMTDARIVERLFAGVCPELREGRVRVMGVVRRAGQRTKIAVAPCEEGLDAVAALVGRAHNRVDYVKACLGGEQVDVVAWHPDKAVFLANALQPAEVVDVVIDEGKQVAVAHAPKHQMAAAVGNGGLNSALAGELSGLNVKIAVAA